jgi:hypothetical protein
LNSSILLDKEWSDGAAACTSDAPEDEESIALLGVDPRRWGVPSLHGSMSLGSGRRWPRKDASLVGEIDHGNSIGTNKLVDACLNLISYSCVQQNWGGHYLCDRLMLMIAFGDCRCSDQLVP